MRICVLALWLLLGCRRAPAPATDVADSEVAASDSVVAASDAAPVASAETAAQPPWVPRLDSEAEFLRYSKELGNERFTKFVIHIPTGQIHYVDAEVYRMHKDFVFAELLKTERTKDAERTFDKNYGKDKPAYVMCYLVHHLGADLWSFVFWDGDKATAAHVRLAYRRLRDTFYLADAVKFRPNSNYQETVAAGLPEIPQLTNDELYEQSGYQPFHLGRAVGTLHVVPAGADFDALAFAPTEIVLLPEALPDITPVAGIVSQGFSTPLSHVNLRAGAWGIPNVGAKDAMAKYAKLAGKTVYFEAGESTYMLREATPVEVAAQQRVSKEASTIQVPRADLGVTALTELGALRAKDASAFGSKTANLGEIIAAKLAGVNVPSGFGVPIAHYAAHVKNAGLDTRIQQMLADSAFRASQATRKASLAALRHDLAAAPLDPAFVAELGQALAALGGDAGADPGVFVRSSTNAEDLPGFSGAGLYDTVPNVHGLDAVGRAVKQVWASVWNLAAYEERERYHIDHRRVFGAVLVQIGIDAAAAGVLVTAHPTDPSATNTFTINAKSGLGIRVVSGKKVPEIVLYNVFNKGLRVLSRSGEDAMTVFDADGGVRDQPVQAGKPVLSTERVALLGEAARKLRGIFPKEGPLDIEWVFRGDELFIVQSRPYMVKLAPPATSPTER